jgi:SNF2 family DNA or RNA helicase
MKEWSAERTKAAVQVLKKAKRAVLLSGTPTRNAPNELHPQLCSLIPNFFVKSADFRSRYCLQEQRMLFGGNVVSVVVGARNSGELNYLLTKTAMVRRLKRDVLQELPAKRRQKVPLEITDAKQMKNIRKSTDDLPGSFVMGSDGTQAVQSVFKATAEAKLPAVKEYLLEVLERGDEKAIIFAHHHIMLDEISALLEKRLAKDGLHHVRIDGRTPGAKRQELVKEFQTDPTCRIALLSITACGEGLTLSAAGLVIFAELYWVPGAIEQAEARAHRIGSTHNKVVVEFLVVPNSPEERIYSQLERKKRDTSKVLDKTDESMGAIERLTQKRLREIAFEKGYTGAEPDIDTAKKVCLGTSAKQSAVLPKATAKVKDAAVTTSPAPKVNDAAVTESPAPKRSLDFVLGGIGSKKAAGVANNSPALETPPPVSRWKVEHLLRAAKG